MEKRVRVINSPIGKLWLAQEGDFITELLFTGEAPEREKEETPLLLRAEEELNEYFLGKRRKFDLPLLPKGTEFQKAVWKALLTIPYGETRSYQEIACLVGCPKGQRAVGMANNRNPISIFIPCHRVIGKNGALTGYGGGEDKKEYLLRLEKG